MGDIVTTTSSRRPAGFPLSIAPNQKLFHHFQIFSEASLTGSSATFPTRNSADLRAPTIDSGHETNK
ncbi:hypothetical protein AHAS_Ahas10G0026800 [Arachis hypogaea]